MRYNGGECVKCVAADERSCSKYTMIKVWSSLPTPLPRTFIMPIAPIVGKLRKRALLDLSLGIGLGFSAAYAFWWV